MKYSIFLCLFFITCIQNLERDTIQNAVARVLMRELFTDNKVQSFVEINLPFSLQNVPEKVTLPIPRSIRKSTSTSIRNNSQQGNGYSIFSDSVSKISELISDSMRDQILLDQVYSLAKQKPNECIAGNTIQVRFTPEMLEYIRRSFLDFGYTEESSFEQLKLLQKNYKIPKENELVPNPAVRYSNGEYAHQLDYTIGARISDAVPCPDTNVFQKRLSFSEGKQKLLYRFKYTTSSLGSLLNIFAEITLDNSNKTMRMDIDTRQIQDSIETGLANSIDLEECKNTSNCLLVRSVSQIFYPKNPLQISGLDISLSLTEKDVYTIIEGKIDLEGGFFTTEFSNKPSGTSHLYRELFNETGTLTHYETYNQDAWVSYLSYPNLPAQHRYSDFQLSIQKNTQSILSDIKIIATRFDAPLYPESIDALGGKDIQLDIFIIARPNCDPNVYTYCIVGKGSREALPMPPYPSVEDLFSKFTYYGFITESVGSSVWRIECCNSKWGLKYTKLKNPVGLQKTVYWNEPISFSNSFFIIIKKGCNPNLGLVGCILGTGERGEPSFLNYYNYGLVNNVSETEVWKITSPSGSPQEEWTYSKVEDTLRY